MCILDLRDQWQLAIDFNGYPGQYILRNTVPRMLVLDIHKAQKVSEYFTSNGTIWMHISSTTCLNKPLKSEFVH